MNGTASVCVAPLIAADFVCVANGVVPQEVAVRHIVVTACVQLARLHAAGVIGGRKTVTLGGVLLQSMTAFMKSAVRAAALLVRAGLGIAVRLGTGVFMPSVGRVALVILARLHAAVRSVLAGQLSHLAWWHFIAFLSTCD